MPMLGGPRPSDPTGMRGERDGVDHCPRLEEAVTDPDLNAWYDTRGYENADKCAWTFGATYTVANGGQANLKLSSATTSSNETGYRGFLRPFVLTTPEGKQPASQPVHLLREG